MTVRAHGKIMVYYSSGIADQVNQEIGRRDVIRLSAHYKAGRHVCGADSCGYPYADGTQYTDMGPNGENIDMILWRPGIMTPGWALGADTIKDSLLSLPRGLDTYASYVDNYGGWTQLLRLRDRLNPNGVYYSYTIFGNAANCADTEAGAMRPSDIPHWVDNVGIPLNISPHPQPPEPPKEATMIQTYVTADHRIGIAAETSSGEVLHIEQHAQNGDWWRDNSGKPKWLSLGTPGK